MFFLLFKIVFVKSVLFSLIWVVLLLFKDKLLLFSFIEDSDFFNNFEMCMCLGDCFVKKGDVFVIKKFKFDKEGDVLIYVGIS